MIATILFAVVIVLLLVRLVQSLGEPNPEAWGADFIRDWKKAREKR